MNALPEPTANEPAKETLDLGIGQPVDEKWLKIQDEVRKDVEWALDAGQGKFLIACFAVVPAGTCNPAGLPPDVQLPRDKDKPQVANRIHAYFPYGDLPLPMRQFRDYLSLLLRQRHQREMAELEGQKLKAEQEPLKLAVVPPDGDYSAAMREFGDSAEKEEMPHPMLCFAHGGSPSAQQHNMNHGFACPKCQPSPKEEAPSDDQGPSVPAEPEALGS